LPLPQTPEQQSVAKLQLPSTLTQQVDVIESQLSPEQQSAAVSHSPWAMLQAHCWLTQLFVQHSPGVVQSPPIGRQH
jgi:hypothetical protein